jgi:DNA-binding MarR family transcriptional regulator
MNLMPKRATRETSASKLRLRLWLRLLRATRHIEAELRERLRVEFATTLPRFDAMAALHRHGKSMTMTALSRELIVSNGNVTGLVDRLVADGLVMRTAADGDRRAIHVRLTPKGQRAFEVMAAAHEAWVEELLAGVRPADANLIMELLERRTEAASAG